MDDNLYNLIDTFLKIGLGSVIGFLSSFFLTKLNYKLKNKERFQEKHDLKLEEIADKADEYFQKFISLVGSVSGAYKEYTVKGQHYSIETRKYINKQDELLQKTWEGKYKAVSRLKMLGYDKEASVLDSVTSLQSEFRRAVILERFELEITDLDNTAKEIFNIQTEFFKLLSKKYIQQG